MNVSAAGSQTIADNTITNLNVNTSGSVFLVRNSGKPARVGSQTITNNRIVGTFNKAQQGGSVVGLNNTGAGDVSANMVQSNNNFSNVTVTGTTTASCVLSQAAGVRTIEGNVCNNWVGGAGGLVTGIRLQGFTGGSAATVDVEHAHELLVGRHPDRHPGGGDLAHVHRDVEHDQHVQHDERERHGNYRPHPAASRASPAPPP